MNFLPLGANNCLRNKDRVAFDLLSKQGEVAHANYETSDTGDRDEQAELPLLLRLGPQNLS